MTRSKTGFLFRSFWGRMREQESMSTNDRERGRGEEEGGRILDGGQGLFSSPLHVAHAPAKFSSRLSLTWKEIFIYSFGISRNRWSSAKQRKKSKKKIFRNISDKMIQGVFYTSVSSYFVFIVFRVGQIARGQTQIYKLENVIQTCSCYIIAWCDTRYHVSWWNYKYGLSSLMLNVFLVCLFSYVCVRVKSEINWVILFEKH